MKLNRIRDDRGFSLIELIVSILIMSVITGMVIILISTSQSTYNEVNTESVVQRETEAVRSFINELAIEAKDCGSAGFTYAPPGGTTKAYSCIWFMAPDNNDSAASTNYYCYFLLLEEDSQIVRYGKYPAYQEETVEGVTTRVLNPILKNGDTLLGAGFDYGGLLVGNSTRIAGNEYALLAQHVTSLSLTKSAGLITVGLELGYNNASYTKTLIFAGRNM